MKKFFACLVVIFGFTLANEEFNYGEVSEVELRTYYFFGGFNRIELNRMGSQLEYQLVDMSSFEVLTEGSGEGDTYRFLITLENSANTICSPFVDLDKDRKKFWSRYRHFVIVHTEDMTSTIGGGGCLASYAEYFNWGDWIDILASSPETLPTNSWIPISAFRPLIRHRGSSVRRALAKDWLVLLVMFTEDASQAELPLTRAQVISRLETYGVEIIPWYHD
ncbi:MAG: hypothetical protein AAF708_13420 [Deinococcota bacterium]